MISTSVKKTENTCSRGVSEREEVLLEDDGREAEDVLLGTSVLVPPV